MKKCTFLGLFFASVLGLSSMAEAACGCADKKTYSNAAKTVMIKNLNPGTAPDHQYISAVNVNDNTTVRELKLIARQNFSNPDYNRKNVELYTKSGCGCGLGALFGSHRLCDNTRLGDIDANDELQFAIDK